MTQKKIHLPLNLKSDACGNSVDAKVFSKPKRAGNSGPVLTFGVGKLCTYQYGIIIDLPGKGTIRQVLKSGSGHKCMLRKFIFLSLFFTRIQNNFFLSCR